MPELIAALDVGTTTARAAIFSPAGALLALVRGPLRSRNPEAGRVEQDADTVWRTTRRVLSLALDQAGCGPADIAAIGVTTQRASIVVWDRRTGRPVGPMVIWSDLRGVQRARELAAAGFMLAPQQAATKLESVLADLGRPLADLAWGGLDSFLIWKLSGGAVHATDASQGWPTGYFDLFKGTWNTALIAHQGLGDLAFPRLVDTLGVMGHTDAAVFGARVPIAADIADQQSALIAHGEAAGTAKVTFGTSATLDLSTGPDLVFKSMTAPPFVLSASGGETLFCLEGMVLSAGSALDWMRGLWRLGDHRRFEALAAGVAGTAGSAFLPALQGLGSPHGDAERRGAVVGLNSTVGPAQIARAGLEGIAFRVREAAEYIFDLAEVAPPEALGVDGGLTSNHTFLQVQADMLKLPIRRHANAEATVCGAAICAGRGVGLLQSGDVEAFRRTDKTFTPSLSPDEADSRFAQWKALVYAGA